MAFDLHANFAASLITSAPSPNTSGTLVSILAGDEDKFPTPPFNCAVYPLGLLPHLALETAELVRVTAISGNVLTIVRAQGGSNARAITFGDVIENVVDVSVFTNIEGAITAETARAQAAEAAIASGAQVGVDGGSPTSSYNANIDGGSPYAD